jgi:hypothetical protein
MHLLIQEEKWQNPSMDLPWHHTSASQFSLKLITIHLKFVAALGKELAKLYVLALKQ